MKSFFTDDELITQLTGHTAFSWKISQASASKKTSVDLLSTSVQRHGRLKGIFLHVEQNVDGGKGKGLASVIESGAFN
jgi:hypothetical protein